MAQYIDKSALLEYLNQLYEKHSTPNSVDEGGVVINDIEYFIDTLEVKDVDLEKEINEWLLRGSITDTRYDDYCDDDIIETAKHFFELGLKAKGE